MPSQRRLLLPRHPLQPRLLRRELLLHHLQRRERLQHQRRTQRREEEEASPRLPYPAKLRLRPLLRQRPKMVLRNGRLSRISSQNGPIRLLFTLHLWEAPSIPPWRCRLIDSISTDPTGLPLWI